jgi:flagellar biosynthetic protein FlhB
MARSDEDGERTEQPTAQRLIEARRQGEVARSTDLTAALVLTGAMLALGLAGGPLLDAMTKMTARMLDFRSIGPAGTSAGDVLAGAAGVLTAAGLLAAAVLVVAVAANVMQVGFLAAGRLVSPDGSRVSPGEGLRRMFSRRAAVRGLAAAAKLAVVGGIAYVAIRGGLRGIAGIGLAAADELVGRLGRVVWRAGMAMSVALLALGLLDWLYQRWEFRQEHRMTPREVAEELQNTETYKQLRRQAARPATPNAPEKTGKDAANG